MGKGGKGAAHDKEKFQRIFCTVDPAASAREGPGDKDIWRKQASYTVISTWGLTQDYNLLWLDMRRFRKEIPDILAEVSQGLPRVATTVFHCRGDRSG